MFGPILWLEGIIGAGKSTLTATLAKAFNFRPIYEPVETNPYLGRFYEDQKRWGFAMQIELLHRRYAMQKLAAYEAVIDCGFKGSILDRGLPGDRVFARLLRLSGMMDELEWRTYELAYNVMACSLTPPSLLVFLDVEPEVALERVRARARAAEASIPLKYLQDLRKGYLDLMIEIESGQHAWSRGMEVMRVPWNVDHQPTEALIKAIAGRLRL